MAPTVPKISDTGTSKGMIIVREMMSQIMIVAIPIRQTHGKLLLKSSRQY
jgi:hypothetical protein